VAFQEEVAQLQARLADARAERDTAQASGQQEKYLHACFRLQALERQLEDLGQDGRRASASEDVMAELGITLRDGAYCVGASSYARLEDAVAYARLLRTQGRRAG
jgi:hypothetical protein